MRLIGAIDVLDVRQKDCWNPCIFIFCVYVVISKFVATTLHHVKRELIMKCFTVQGRLDYTTN